MDGVSRPETIVVHVPFSIVKRGGRKQIEPPANQAAPRSADATLLKALARAFRWKRMLDTGEFATIAELAEREAIAISYLARVLRLTLLAPELVDAILDEPGAMPTAEQVLRGAVHQDWCVQKLTLKPPS